MRSLSLVLSTACALIALLNWLNNLRKSFALREPFYFERLAPRDTTARFSVVDQSLFLFARSQHCEPRRFLFAQQRIVMKGLISAALVAIFLLLGCSAIGDRGNSASPPTDVALVPGDGSVTVTWTMQPGVEYWLFYGPTGFISTSNWTDPSVGGQVIRGATSPTVLSGLPNGVTYSVTINGRTDGGPGGDGSPSLSAIPRLAGGTWAVEPPVAGAPDLHGVLYTSVLVAAGSGGGLYSSVGAANWTALSNPAVPANANLNAVVYGGSYLAVGASGIILNSPDAITWTQEAVGNTSNELMAIATNGGGAYVAVGRSGTVLFSIDGLNWSAPIATPAGSVDLHGVIVGNGMWVVVGAGGTVLTSPDGLTWTLGNSNTVQNLNGIARGSIEFVAVGDGGAIVTSPDGLSWTALSPISVAKLNAVTAGAQFVAVGDAGGIFTSADDGATWQSRTSGTSSNLYAISRWGSGYAVVGAAGTNLLAQ
jgi:hypothetical protein